jgi:Uma2 family endonuclease
MIAAKIDGQETLPMTLLAPPDSEKVLPTLESGDRMNRQEFHAIYEQMREHFKAELIGGVVYVASPLKLRHGRNHLPIGSLLFAYESNTPGTESGDNTTVILGDDSEPQPDLFLRILPRSGGKTKTTKTDYVFGPPELIVEIAHSSKAIDLYSKREDYLKYGVCEYLVLCVDDQQLRWFDLQANKELAPAADGVVRLTSFPGLWIDVAAVFARNFNQLLKVLNEGMATPEHQAFVAKLSKAKVK